MRNRNVHHILRSHTIRRLDLGEGHVCHHRFSGKALKEHEKIPVWKLPGRDFFACIEQEREPEIEYEGKIKGG